MRSSVHFPWYISLLGCLLMLFVACGEDDPCEGVECLNGGVCVGGICECPGGFVGEDCGLVDVTSFVGNYEGRYEGCFQTSPDHIVQIDQSTVTGFALSFINLGDYACPSSVDGRMRLEAQLDGSAITLPEQLVCEDGNFGGYRFTGSGTVFQDSVRLDFQVRYDVGGSLRTDNCTAILVKP